MQRCMLKCKYPEQNMRILLKSSYFVEDTWILACSKVQNDVNSVPEFLSNCYPKHPEYWRTVMYALTHWSAELRDGRSVHVHFTQRRRACHLSPLKLHRLVRRRPAGMSPPIFSLVFLSPNLHVLKIHAESAS